MITIPITTILLVIFIAFVAACIGVFIFCGILLLLQKEDPNPWGLLISVATCELLALAITQGWIVFK